ncbi:MAG: Cof-type HAD-IIB family hydrolase [Lachnospiraceae bacterium]
MNDIKLIALDLDGTLLNSKKQLSQGNLWALKSCIAKGIQIVPTTGRTVDGVPSVIKEIPGVRYAIATNGAVIFDMQTQTVIDKRMLDKEQVLTILEILEQYPVMYDPYINGRGISEEKFFEHMDRYGLTKEFQEMVRVTRDVVPNIIRFVKESNSPVEKINMFFAEPSLKREIRERLKEISNIIITSSIPLNLEINHPEATKGKGILRLARHLGISREETMAFGDGENDHSMIEEAGIGIAMENGMNSLKMKADYVTKSNDEDGVAAAIDRFILGKW